MRHAGRFSTDALHATLGSRVHYSDAEWNHVCSLMEG